jgi:hypothetical protein
MFSLTKLISGFNLADGEKVGKLIFYAILITIGLSLYHLITRPTQTIVAKKGSNVTVSQDNKSKSRWGIGGNIQSDKTVGVSVMYMF